MIKRSRIRLVAKWFGLGTCVVLMAAWAVTLRFSTRISITDLTILQTGEGSIGLAFFREDEGTRQELRDIQRSLHWIRDTGWSTAIAAPQFQRLGPGYSLHTVIVVPFWLGMMAAGIPTILLFVDNRRRRKPIECRVCGYNLTGNESGICSECGTKIGDPNGASNVGS